MANLIEIILFFLSSFLSLITYKILGEFFLKEEKNNIFEKIIYGVIVASCFALFLNFFIPLNKTFNTFFQICVIFIFFLLNNKKINFSEINKIFIISILIILLISYDTENRPDAYLYHLPYSQIIIENKIIPGISILHSRFAHISIFQYLSSFNYTYFSGLDGLIIPSAGYCIVIFFYFLNDIKSLEHDKISSGKLFSLIIFIYICIKINRYSEFGNDAMAHLTVFFIISQFFYLNIHKVSTYKNIYLLSGFAFLNKPFLIFTLIFPFYLFFKNNFKLKDGLFNLSTILILFWLFKNILVSGCAIFPVEKTCIKKLPWTEITQVKQHKVLGEAWAKAWPDRKKLDISKEKFIKDFNWLNAWKSKHLNVFYENLVPFLIIIVVLNLYIRNSGLHNIQSVKEKNIVILIFSIISTSFFMLKFPLFRFGYSFLIVLLSLIFLFSLKKANYQNFFKSVKYLSIFLLFILIAKQSIRIVKYYETRTLLPNDRFLNLNQQSQIKKIRIDDNFSYYFSKNECKYFRSPCTSSEIEKIQHRKIFGYNVLAKKF